MSAREYEQWHEDHTWDPSRQPGPVLQTDLAPANWIEPLLPDHESSAPALLPLGFNAYARIFVPFCKETAAERHERIAEALTEPMPGADQDDQAAYCGFLPPDQFEALLPILARHTSSPTSCGSVPQIPRGVEGVCLDQRPFPGPTPGYRRERRGRSLSQARMPMAATNSQGDNRRCRTKPTTASATIATSAIAMIQNMSIGLRSR
jgi:hypothetical protein